MFALLKKTLNSLAVMLEIKQIGSLNNSTKLIEEILLYLSCLISFVPKKCVLCTKQLLKYVFQSNYACKKAEYDYFVVNGGGGERLATYEDVGNVYDGIKRLQLVTIDDSDMAHMSDYMRLFQPIVVQCLKVIEMMERLSLDGQFVFPFHVALHQIQCGPASNNSQHAVSAARAEGTQLCSSG
jgi:hypothetical protein